MGVLLVLVILAAFAAMVLVGWLATTGAQRRHAIAEPDFGIDSLNYLVPEGTDTAAVLAAFAGSDFEASLRERDAERVLVVACPHGATRDRDEVRSRIAHAGTALDDAAPTTAVRFTDE